MQVLALGTVMGTALGSLMFLDKDRVASSVGLRAAAILLVILNVAFLALVAWLVLKHGKRHAKAFLRQAKAISKGALHLVKAAVIRCNRLCKPSVPGDVSQTRLSTSSPQANVAMPVRATRSASMQPMLSERVLSVPISSSSSTSLNNSHH